MKVLHIVENLDKGAVENWLISVFVESRKYEPEMEWTFFCLLNRKGRLDDLVKSNGGQIVYSPFTFSNKIAFLKNLRTVIKSGEFDIVHSHHDFTSGFYLIASFGLKIKKRILHIHNMAEHLPFKKGKVATLLYRNVFWLVNYWLNDLIVGIASETADYYLKGYGKKKKRVLHYGIDFTKIDPKDVKNDIKMELHLPASVKLLLFVGKLDDLKNPIFLVDILYKIKQLDSSNDYRIIYVGEGDFKQTIINHAEKLQVLDLVFFLGFRNDVNKIMSIADVFIFPRVEYEKEGLGKVIIEALATGLPVITTTGIPNDAIINKRIVKIHHTEEPAELWAKSVIEFCHQFRERDKSFDIAVNSSFSLKNGTLNLLKLYR